MSGRQIGIRTEFIEMLTSKEATDVCGRICAIYYRLILARDELWESDSVLCLRGGEVEGQVKSAWEQLRELMRVSPKEIKKSLQWMQEKGIVSIETDEENDMMRFAFEGLLRQTTGY